jgi:small subunit ribosomal protein S16
MAVKIRLQRKGRKKAPFYQIVIADARAPRDGRFIEKIGIYNPLTIPATIELDRAKALAWLHNGAQPTDTVRAIFRFKGVTYQKHLLEGVKKGALTAEQADAKLSAWVEAKENQVADHKNKVKETKRALTRAVDGTPKPKVVKVVEAPVVEHVAGDDMELVNAGISEESMTVVQEANIEVVERVVEAAPVVEAIVETVEVVEAAPVVEAVVETVEVVEAAPVVEAVVETVEVVEAAPVVEAVVETVEVVEAAPVVEAVVETVEVVEEAPVAEAVVETVEVVEAAPVAEAVVETVSFVDNVILIDGIGPKTTEALAEAGVTTLTQIAAMSDAELAELAEKIGSAGDEIAQEWKVQALEMIGGAEPRAQVDKDLARKLAQIG